MSGDTASSPRLLLVVSGDRELVATCEAVLPAHGYVVVRSPEPGTAVAQVGSIRPSVVLVDGDPRAPALAMLDALRADETADAVPVVLAVEQLTTEGVNEAIHRGAHDFLRKPVDGAELVARVLAAQRMGQLQREVEAHGAAAAELLRIDPLTGLSSRRSVEEHLEVVAASARRLRTPFSVLVIDVDRLQRVNRDLGKAAGDAVLRSVARTISSALRGEDVAGRRGGDQFLVVLPHTSLDGAWRLADRIRQAVSDRPVALDDQRDVLVTVSAGCSEGAGDDPGDQVRRAQVALWEAKSTGRNRAVADTSALAS
ncbi:MAG: diguanylate cyclase [Actinobacteria bacterium]|nr:diguanylate cyclase [Actinomycetota bacterium]